MGTQLNFRSTDICYTTESGDEYSYLDILDIAKGNERLARIILDTCSWQHPETVFEELVMEEEINEEGQFINQE